MNNSLQDNIDAYKRKFYLVPTFNHKYSLFCLISLLEDYLNNKDIGFYNSVNTDGNYQDKLKFNCTKLHDSFNNYINNNNLLDNTIRPYFSNSIILPHIEKSINPNVCLSIISDFLLKVDPYLYNMFCELYNNKHILFNGKSSCGLEFNEKKKDSIYIIVGTLCNVTDMATLVHELGHAYKDYIFEDYHRYFDLDNVLSSEISSKTLELLFLNYLIHYNIYKEDAMYSLHNYQSLINSGVNKIYSLGYHNSDTSIKDLSYIIGSIIANDYIINGNKSYRDFIRMIYLKDIKSILKRINNKENIIKSYCLKKQ